MIFFRQNLHEVITLPEPPVDDLTEAYQVEKIIRQRTEKDVQSIQDHDQEPYYAIRKVCEKNGIEFHDSEFKQIIKESVPIIKHFKDFYNRARPAEVLSSLNTLPSKTNKTPSYPSGHATQSVILARYVAGKVPQLEKDLMKAAYECGYGRVQAGFHYVSDYDIGNLLGEKMYVLMNKMDYGQEMNEGKVAFKDFLKN
jgi:acid phosphatase (class A)